MPLPVVAVVLSLVLLFVLWSALSVCLDIFL